MSGSPAKRNELCVEIHLLKQKRTCFDFCSYTQTHKQREKQLVHTPTHHTPSHIKNLRTFIKIFRNFKLSHIPSNLVHNRDHSIFVSSRGNDTSPYQFYLKILFTRFFSILISTSIFCLSCAIEEFP